MFRNLHRSSIHVAGSFCLLLLSYHLIFRGYFPLPNGHMGHDYTLTLSGLLDGYLWFKKSGFLNPPWFSPSFCGGQAFFSDPQSIFYSLPQFLTFVVDPLQAVYWAFLIFAVLGFWGMYFYTRTSLKLGRSGALIASAIFMFNGFYAQRMLIGHYGFQSFMLVPLVACLLLKNLPSIDYYKKELPFTILAGILIAYWFHSGMTTLMIPAMFAVIALACLHQIRTSENIAWAFLIRGLIAGAIAIALSISKLNANLSLMANFSRDYYLLPGISDPAGLVTFVFQSLFYPSEHVYQTVTPLWKNLQWAAMPHELAYTLTPIPLSILVIGLGIFLLKRRKIGVSPARLVPVQYLAAALLASIFLLPFALLYYSPSWNEVLKSLPLIGSTTSPFRWLIMFIPAIAALTGMAGETLGKYKQAVTLIVLLSIPALNALEDRSYYQNQNYNPSETVNYYNAVQLGQVIPRIVRVGIPSEHNGQIAQGISPTYCYNPLYGYRLEKLKIEPLVYGPITNITPSGTLNLHNPACLVFPAENNCNLWDAFTTSQSSQLLDFSSYRPYAFERSHRQKIADWITKSTCIALIFGLAILLFARGISYQPPNLAWLRNCDTSIQLILLVLSVAILVSVLTNFVSANGLTPENLKYINNTFAASIYAFNPEPREQAAYLLSICLFPIFAIALTLHRAHAQTRHVISNTSRHSVQDLFGVWVLLILISTIITASSENPFGQKFGFFGYSIIQALIHSPNILALLVAWLILFFLTWKTSENRELPSCKYLPRKFQACFLIDALSVCLILFTAASISFIPNDKGALVWATDAGHMAPLFEPAAIAYLTGATADVDMFSQYGGLVEFARPLLWLADGDPSALIWFAFISLACSLIFLWLAIRRVTVNPWLALVAIGALMFWTGLKFMEFANFQAAHFRWLFPSLYLFLAAYQIHTNRRLALLPYFLGAIALYWNAETGAAALFAWIGWRSIAQLIPLALSQSKNTDLCSMLIKLVRATFAFLFGVLLLTIYLTLKSGGKWLDLHLMFGAAKDFYLCGFFMLPMPLLHLWGIYAVIAATLFLIGIRHYATKQPAENALTADFLVYSSLLFSLLFSYYQGRSFYGNLLIISYPLWLALTAWLSKKPEPAVSEVASSRQNPLKILVIGALTLGLAAIPFTDFYLLHSDEIPSREKNREDKEALRQWVRETSAGRTPLFLSFSAWRLMLITGSAPADDAPRLSYLIRREQRAAFIENLSKPNLAVYYDLSNDDYFKREEIFESEQLKEQIAEKLGSNLINGVKFSNSQTHLLLLNPLPR